MFAHGYIHNSGLNRFCRVVGLCRECSLGQLQMSIKLLCLLSAMTFTLSSAICRAQSSGLYSVVHGFGGEVNGAPDGVCPVAGATFDSAGNMYGTTSHGGGDYYSSALVGGIVWEITSTGIYKDLHDFGGTVNGVPDGSIPSSGVTLDSAGNLYGVTLYGGANGSGTVWEITSSGEYKDLHDFGGTINGIPDGYFPEANVKIDSAGNMYGTTGTGGANQNNDGGIVWEINSSGTYINIHDFGGTVNGVPDGGAPSGVTLDSSGNIFGTTNGGGAYLGGVVWEIASSGTYQVLHNFGGSVNGAADGSGPGSGVAFDRLGNIYGTTIGGGVYGAISIFNGGIVWEITSSGTYRDIHDFGGTINGAPDGFNPIAGVILDSAGNLYGTAPFGGTNWNATNDAGGMVWTITASGTYKDIHDFGGTINGVPDGFKPEAIVTCDNTGNIYGTTFRGGPYDGGGAFDGGILWEIVVPAPSANSQTVQVSGPTAITLTGSDPQALPLTFALSTAPAHGSLSAINGTTGAVTYTPISGFQGTDSFTFTVSDGTNISAPAAVTLIVTSIGVKSIILSPPSVIGSQNAAAIVTLQAPSTGATVVTLVTNNSTAAKPANTSLRVPAGSTRALFPIITSAVSSSTSVTFTATSDGISASSTLTVTPPPPPKIESLTVAPSDTVGGGIVTGSVMLQSPATAGGVVVSLSSSNPTIASVPATLTVATGALQASFEIRTNAVAAVTAVTITATANGSSQTAALTLTSPPPPPSPFAGSWFGPYQVVSGSATGPGTVAMAVANNGSVTGSLYNTATKVASAFMGSISTSGLLTTWNTTVGSASTLSGTLAISAKRQIVGNLQVSQGASVIGVVQVTLTNK